MKLLLLTACLFLHMYAVPTFAHELSGKTLLLKYEQEQHYKVSFEEKDLTWKGVKGDDKNSETDPYQFKKIATEIYLVNWTEKDGTFVDIVLNFASMKVYSSGKSGESTWLREGDIQF